MGIQPLDSDFIQFYTILAPGKSQFLGKVFLRSVNLKDCWCVFFFLFFFVGLCVSWQHPGLCGVRLRHGGGGQHVHGAVQRAEISRLHLDAFSWGEGSQAEVQKQLINRSTLTHTHKPLVCHTHKHAPPLFTVAPLMHYLTSPLPHAQLHQKKEKERAPYRQMKREIILQMAA